MHVDRASDEAAGPSLWRVVLAPALALKEVQPLQRREALDELDPHKLCALGRVLEYSRIRGAASAPLALLDACPLGNLGDVAQRLAGGVAEERRNEGNGRVELALQLLNRELIFAQREVNGR